MRYLVLILCSLMLAGCPKSGTLKGSGEVAPPPVGWDAHCKAVPTPDECQK